MGYHPLDIISHVYMFMVNNYINKKNKDISTLLVR